MDYWISMKNAQAGPYSLLQLQFMWQQGQLTSNTYYYDALRKEWILLQGLVESTKALFTVEEAFVRLGQNRQKGCLSVYNQEETLHLFVDQGYVICVVGDKEQGEFGLARALHLDNSNYEWFFNAQAPTANLHLNITEYALRNSIARDVKIGAVSKSKHNTVAFPVALFDKVELKLNFTWILVSEALPEVRLRLTKITSVLGREEHCDVTVDDTRVSRKHCLLELWEQNVKVKDLGSSNGTFINGTPVRDGFLREGDQLSLGSYKFFLEKEQKKAPNLAG